MKTTNGNVTFKYIDKLWTVWMLSFLYVLIVSLLWLNCVPQRIRWNNICLDFKARIFKHYSNDYCWLFLTEPVSHTSHIKTLRLLRIFIGTSVSVSSSSIDSPIFRLRHNICSLCSVKRDIIQKAWYNALVSKWHTMGFQMFSETSYVYHVLKVLLLLMICVQLSLVMKYYRCFVLALLILDYSVC